MTKKLKIHRRSDGSVDMDHYLRTAGVERAHAVRGAKTSARGSAKRLASSLLALIVLSAPHERQS